MKAIKPFILAAVLAPFAQMHSIETTDLSKEYKGYTLSFNVDNLTARLVQIEVTGFDADIVIPEEIDGYTVTEIGQKSSDSESAPSDFSDFEANCCSVFCSDNGDDYYLTEIRSICIPSSVSAIWPKAFSGDEIMENGGNGVKFQTINIPNSVVRIGAGAFQYTSFKDIVLPDALTDVYPNTFDKCEDLTSIRLGKNINEVWDRAFSGINGSAIIHIDTETVPKIRKNSFSNGCTAEIHIPFGTLDDYQKEWGYWNLRFVEMSEGQTSSVSAIKNLQFYAQYRQGRIQADAVEPIIVFTAFGQIMSSGSLHIDIPATKGVYILKSGADVKKILVK